MIVAEPLHSVGKLECRSVLGLISHKLRKIFFHVKHCIRLKRYKKTEFEEH